MSAVVFGDVTAVKDRRGSDSCKGGVPEGGFSRPDLPARPPPSRRPKGPAAADIKKDPAHIGMEDLPHCGIRI